MAGKRGHGQGLRKGTGRGCQGYLEQEIKQASYNQLFESILLCSFHKMNWNTVPRTWSSVKIIKVYVASSNVAFKQPWSISITAAAMISVVKTPSQDTRDK